ncbi:MAG TPA: hypothetical protein VJ853_04910 [Thermoanaerobaculia bacterium]|nr:hypothetical protein [Thermoanaerobaculia bacterium]
MKKLFLSALSIVGFFLIAAPIYMKMESHPLVTNGKPFSNAALINGQWAVPLEDFAKLGGSGLTLEPNFQLQGSTLSALLPAVQTQKKHVEASTAADSVTVPGSAYKEQKVYTGGVFHVQRAGVISKNVFMYNGKAYVPLADVARAFGGTFTAPANKLQPGQSLSLNFTVNGDGFLAFNP